MNSIKKELKILRGTYAEIQQQPTEDMTIYLSWDTQEIFVGNSYGIKTPYIGGQKLTEREVRELFDSLTDDELNLLRSQIATVSITSSLAKTAADNVSAELVRIEGELDEVLTDKINELLEDGEVLEDLVTTEEVSILVNGLLSGYYNNDQVDAKFPAFPVIPNGVTFKGDYETLRTKVYSNETTLNQYASIKILADGEISESQLISNLSTIEDGIYRFQSPDGYELLNKSGQNLFRLSPDGRTYELLNMSWSVVPVDPGIIKSVNGVTTTNGSVTIDAGNIGNTSSRIWNSLLPQDGTIVNPLGRNQSKSIGDNSVSFGYNSSAEADQTIAIGSGAMASQPFSIQIGNSETANIEEGTLRVWDHKLLDRSTGKIPTERITETFRTLTVEIEESDWSGSLETGLSVSVPEMTVNSLVWVSPSEVSISDYSFYGIRAIGQGLNTITFACDRTPIASIFVNLIWRT
jgi:hypothetical protein